MAVHQALEVLGYVCAVVVFIRSRRADAASPYVLAGAAAGAALGARLLYWLCDPLHTTPLGGKTVVGGLLGGLIGVELAKKLAGITRSTGDQFVLPLITAMAIGRIGCFLAGPADHTAGNPSSLPWAMAMGDPVRRHPVALYEIAFLLALVPLVRMIQRGTDTPVCASDRVDRSVCATGDSFRFFLASYLAFRFAIDFLKPDPPPVAFALTSIQWACLGGIGYYALVLTKRVHDRSDEALPLL
jgi:phosphatidylglycerol---prolipoprotein diacylglyceryl transferase